MRPWLLRFLLAFLVTTSNALGSPTKLNQYWQKPKLVIVMVIDQFRADYLSRFSERFRLAKSKDGELGGFNYLLQEGAYFQWAEYSILQSMTGPGHATILTGSYPYQSGIPNHSWFDLESKASVYCVEDKLHQYVGTAPSTSFNKRGASPKNLIGTTLGDEIKNAGYKSKVVSIALKDRSAILLGGHRADLAIWFDIDSFSWVSSDYYLPEKRLPEWLINLNKALLLDKDKTIDWKISGSGSGLSLSESLALDDKHNAGMFGKGFPYSLKASSRAAISTWYGAELTEQTAESAIVAMKLGQGSGPDLLAISFSSHDFLGHAFGPNSREMEEMTIEEDRVLSKFINFINKTIAGGLKNTIIVLTADHGATPNPDLMKSVKIDSGRIDDDKLASEIDSRLTAKFGKLASGRWVTHHKDFNFFLNHHALTAKNIDLATIEAEAKNIIAATHGVAHVVTSSDYKNRQLPPGIFEKQILKTYFPGRSGDLILIPKPFFVDSGYTTSHITGYSYDRIVPLIFLGRPFKPGRYALKTEVVDIAPTMAFVLGIMPPALSEGRVLSESLVTW